MDEIRDVYDLTIDVCLVNSSEREDSQCRARIDYQIAGLPLPKRKTAEIKTEARTAEVPWMRH